MLGAALDGLPKVGEEKYDKLMGVLKKRFEPYGEIRDGCFWMPKGDDGVTKGYAFIEYSKREVRISVSSSYFLCDGHLRVQSERDVWCLHHISWCASAHADTGHVSPILLSFKLECLLRMKLGVKVHHKIVRVNLLSRDSAAMGGWVDATAGEG